MPRVGDVTCFTIRVCIEQSYVSACDGLLIGRWGYRRLSDGFYSGASTMGTIRCGIVSLFDFRKNGVVVCELM